MKNLILLTIIAAMTMVFGCHNKNKSTPPDKAKVITKKLADGSEQSFTLSGAPLRVMYNTVYDPYISSNVYEFNWQYWDTGVTPWVCVDISGEAIWMGQDIQVFNPQACKPIMMRKCNQYAINQGYIIDSVNVWWGQFNH